MSLFLNDVRVFDALAQGRSTSIFKVQDASDEDDGSHGHGKPFTSTPSPPPKHHADSDGIDGTAIPIVAIVFTFIYLIIKAVMAPFHNKNRIAGQKPSSGGLTQEEVAVLQKLQRTLSQMESRVEALETILIEQARSEKRYGSKL